MLFAAERRTTLRIRFSRGFLGSRYFLCLLGTAFLFLLGATGVAAYYWISFGRMIDLRLSGNIQQATARIYATPMQISPGQAMTVQQMADHLQRAGYSELDTPGTPGRYVLHGNEIEIRPSSESYFNAKNRLVVDFANREIQSIRSLDSGAALDSAEVEPELLTNLFDSSREKRRAVSFDEIPKTLREAVLSVEERRFTKQQIFELYANEIYLGNRGSFAIHGFGEASLAYFNKDVRELNLQEEAFLAGLIHAPNRYSTAEHRPERAAEARDRALFMMQENGVITPEQAQAARKAPLRIIAGGLQGSTAP